MWVMNAALNDGLSAAGANTTRSGTTRAIKTTTATSAARPRRTEATGEAPRRLSTSAADTRQIARPSGLIESSVVNASSDTSASTPTAGQAAVAVR